MPKLLCYAEIQANEGSGRMTYEDRIWEAYCAWQAVGRNQDKLTGIALAYDVTPFSIQDCHFDHTADRD